MATTSFAQLEAHRVALTGHCYRMLGGAAEADDAVQETLIRAWKNLDKFEERASVRTWLYRIATNVCLDELSDRSRRARPMEEGPSGTIDDPLESRERSHWLEPIPDARALPSDVDPAELVMLRQSIRLAFVAALQHLPPRQRAALLLADVLGWSAAETASTLEMSPAAVNSALQRARATLDEREVSTKLDAPASLSEEQQQLIESYVTAFERYDVDALTSLLRHDATFSMPPYALWLRGPASVRGWLLGRGSVCKGSRLVPIGASGSPAFGQYHLRPDGTYAPWAVIVLELADNGRGAEIGGWSSFLDTETLFPLFGLPPHLP